MAEELRVRKFILVIVLKGLIFLSLIDLSLKFYLFLFVDGYRNLILLFEAIFYTFSFYLLLKLSQLKFSKIFATNDLLLANKLKKQRDDLEKTVQERTRLLKKHQQVQLNQVRVFANYGKIMAGVLHEMSNPLTIITLSLDKLKSESQCKHKKIIKDALMASDNIQSIITASRKQLVDQASALKNIEDFILYDELKNIVKLFQHHFDSKKIKFELKCSKKIKCVGLRSIFSQIISNLLINSVESFEKKSIKNKMIKIMVDEEKSEFNKNITIKIVDNGCGIKKSNHEKIFSEFFTTKYKYGGTGLGLYFTKKYINQFFHGKILLASRENEGSIFTLIIPSHK